MNLLSPKGGRDTIHLERNGNRTGPFKCNFTAQKFSMFYKEIDVTEGDKVVREIPGREEYHTVTEVHYSPGLGRIPPHYTLSVSKDSAIPKPSQNTTTNHINIHGSTGIQIGDHNVQHLQVAMKEVLASIDNADATREEKEDARNKLHAFLAHPLVAAAVGAGLPLALGLLS
ncbi:RIP homotypic interaction motif-containing protein [Pseudomonas moraviensis]|nr:RIP homotypic interaction motif-containing protein [Pseudomonas moraviensis]